MTKHKKMKPEIKELWIEALRSGQYKQGHNRLRTNNRYCCLGVLCDIVGPLLWNQTINGRAYGIDRDSSEGILPRFLGLGVGLTSEETQLVLADLNDAESKDFNKIADWIQENL